MRAKIYLSDEGYGHIVRQRAILEELIRLEPGLISTVQTGVHYDFASKNIPATHFIERFNNIKWHKQADSSPDLQAIKEYYLGYQEKSQKFIDQEVEEGKQDFVITDFVFEAFNYAVRTNVPSFGVCHFSWDWFFSKLYPRVISDSLFRYFSESAASATTLFFPPLTPAEILSHYKHNAIEVPFIVRANVKQRKWPDTTRFKVLIMDSGAQLLKPSIEKALKSFSNQEIIIGVQEGIELIANDNFFPIPKEQLLVDYVSGADLVIGRPGFNTLSECIAYRVPMLLLSESMNPEMDHNIMELNKLRLGAFISKATFESNFDEFFAEFVDNEYKSLQRNMNRHELKFNGASVVATEILNRI